MPEDSRVKGFPDISAKLAAPAKKSLFERQKAEAEAKRAREKAETEAVYEDFVKSFEDDGSVSARHGAGGRSSTHGFGGGAPGGFGGAPSRRHFTSGGMRGPIMGGSQISNPRKRTYEGLQATHADKHSSQGILGFNNSPAAQRDAVAAFRTSDDEDEKTADRKEAERAAAKPTLHLSSLPPGTSPAVVKALIPSVLVVDNVRIVPPPTQGSGQRRIWSAIVTLAKETAATDMDTVVSSLQNRYLGWGYYLSISRHLSSVAINSALPLTSGLASASSQPFGARPLPQGPGSHLSRAPPPGSHRSGFAPPSSYGPGYGGRTGAALQVDVKPPSDLKQLKLIHKTLENLLTYGPEFEALLMSRPEVQREEKWAWIWDAKSSGGIWYRWKLWDILTNRLGKGARQGRASSMPTTIFETGPNWIAPKKDLQFEYTTKIEEFVSDQDYDSSDEDDSDREDERRMNDASNEIAGDGIGHLNPLQKAKLVHLLARLPTTNAKLRRGDIARITAFAINHAGHGADEVVEMIVSNVTNPFAYTKANPEGQQNISDLQGSKVNDPDDANHGENSTKTTQSTNLTSKDKLDTSSARLVGLYVISDILSCSSTSGVRHAWRYRQLFDSSLKAHKTFERLGRLEKELSWGRLKAEKWRRSINSLLSLWEGWCVFPQSSQEHFVQVFEKPPLTEKEEAEERERVEAEKAAGVFGSKGKSRWRTVDEDAAPLAVGVGSAAELQPKENMELDGLPLAEQEEIDGEPMDEDIDGVLMEDSDMEDVDGKPLEDDAPAEDGENEAESGGLPPPSEPKPASITENKAIQPELQPGSRRRRPKAEDMFADSESE
ncbi:hypothetical protein AJ80_09460 [Polytolypa hystricis UAMH7299]|uniref:CID domain-containing protein n=1 Tax=Polytolypa hystricis (strain UAMH7299) TaxID=1447883 RepID=A0A2B7WHK3_POLH7|nr:hypothetical protein AJ80_09460 [Polytolypa hystricis UAMH7299]